MVDCSTKTTIVPRSRPGWVKWRSWSGKRSGEVAEEVERASTVAEVGGVADGFGDEVFGAANGLDRIVAEDEMAEERGGEGAAGTVGGGGF